MKNSARLFINRIVSVLPCLFWGAVCGVISGALVFLFKLAYTCVSKLSLYLYTEAKGWWLYVIAVFLALAVLTVIMLLIHKAVPEAKGAGIPRTDGLLRGRLSFRPLRTLVATFFGSLVSYLGGLPLGSEGPSVLIGTSVGGALSGLRKKNCVWSRYVMTGGASAGFAVATGAPLAGVLFSLEEVHKRFTPTLFFTVITSVFFATCVNTVLADVFNVSTRLFEVGELPQLTASHVGYLLLFAVFLTIGIALFDFAIALFRRLTAKIKGVVRPWMKVALVFLLSGIIALTFTQAAFSGHDLVHTATELTTPVYLLVILLVVRLIMMLLVTDSGVTGGICIPTLAIGSLFSAVVARLLLAMGLPEQYFLLLVLLGMASFLGGTLRAPLTATVFFIEITWQFSNIFLVALVIFSVTIMQELVAQTPFYDRVMEEIEEEENHSKTAVVKSLELKVSKNAFVQGMLLRDIIWPSYAVVLSIMSEKDEGKQFDYDGERIVRENDKIVLSIKYFDKEQTEKQLIELVGGDFEIKYVDA